MSFALVTLLAAASPEAGSTVPTDVLIYVVIDMDGLQLTIGGAALTTIGGIIGAWIKAWASRNQRTELTPSPLSVELKDQFVSRREFDQHCQSCDSAMKAHISDNERNFEALYTQMRANDKLTAKISG